MPSYEKTNKKHTYLHINQGNLYFPEKTKNKQINGNKNFLVIKYFKMKNVKHLFSRAL